MHIQWNCKKILFTVFFTSQQNNYIVYNTWLGWLCAVYSLFRQKHANKQFHSTFQLAFESYINLWIFLLHSVSVIWDNRRTICNNLLQGRFAIWKPVFHLFLCFRKYSAWLVHHQAKPALLTHAYYYCLLAKIISTQTAPIYDNDTQ